jgi:ABC-2 type transport system permease protein/fluoroquinolone transport system permease protein
MKKFFTLLMQELKIIYRNHFVWFTLFLLAAMVIVVWLLPSEIEHKNSNFFYDATQSKMLESRLVSAGFPQENIVGSIEEIEEIIKDDRSNVGIMLEIIDGEAKFTVVYNGKLLPQEEKMIIAGLQRMYDEITGSEIVPVFEMETIRPEFKPLTISEISIPFVLTYETIVLGYLFVAVMVFLEKQEGSIRVYRVSPSGILNYILAKSILWMVLSVIYSALLVILTYGFNVNWAQLLLLLGISSLFMTLFGLFVSTFFNSISEWLFVAIGILILFSFPQISYLSPSFSPRWITLIPTYPIIFTVKDIIFDIGREGAFLKTMGILSIYTVVAFVLAYIAVNRKLMREGR